MKKSKARSPATGKIPRNGTTGPYDQDELASKPVSGIPKTPLEAAIQRYVELFDYAPIGYVSFDRVGRVEEINQAATQLLRRRQGELIGAPFALCVAQGDTQLFLHHLLHCRASSGRVQTELNLKAPDGTVIPVELSSTPVSSSMKDGARLFQTALIDLTERDRAEKAIRISEERYRNLFSLVPIAVYTCDADGLIVEFNEHATELWGRRPRTNDPNEKYCGSFKIFYPDGRPMPHEKCPMARVLRGEQVPPNELEILVERKDGIRRNVMARPFALRNAQDKIIGAINCLYDITESKRTEQSLAEAARQQGALYDFVQSRHEASSVDHVYAAGLEAILSVLGCDRAAVLLFDEQNTMQFVDWTKLSLKYRRAVAGHSPWKRTAKKPRPIIIKDVGRSDLPKSLKRASQSEGIRALIFIPLIAHEELIGKVMGYYHAPHDVGPEQMAAALNVASQLALGIQHKKADAALRESEELHRAIVRQTSVAMARSDLRGRLIFVNANFCTMLGYTEGELMGKAITDITHLEDIPEARRLFHRLVREGEPYQHEKRYIRKDGSTLWANVSAAPMRTPRSGRTRSIVAVIVDITDRKRAQAGLENAKELLEKRVHERTAELITANQELQSEITLRKRLEGEILQIADREQRRLGQDLHDSLCQHLTATAFLAQAVALRLKDHRVVEVKDLEKIAELINEGVTEARTIARGLHPVEMDPSGLANALRALLHRQSKLPYRLDMDDELSVPNATVALHLYRIAREAVINAHKHARARELVLRMRSSPKMIELSVTDDGIGIPRTPGDKSGMGFHIMDYRARLMGARLEIRSVRPCGTCVACYVPLK